MLTRKVIAKAAENAGLTGKGRLIVAGRYGMLDVENSPDARARVREKGWKVLAAIGVDGEVTREGTGKQRRQKKKKGLTKDRNRL